ncbi:Microtubule-actin cross-linking factor 1, isoforms 1/2/3/5 [Araneus ventricosus]|uniref:Microtubule-actin cross-linking factor 1, isoforms 1/2/3/5 n=1 Tax=Araneus ventricosus TaxID=182803 RepID=A0A4Y2CY09_ARAVE|nr:Microtubule-actin cross-linking factor 1, isoforms 1/2/3/5 [Araneus ventricosus]
MVWGAISYDSRSTLVVIPNTLNANLYVSLVIQPVVLPFMSSIQGGIFQQDNARPHTAAVSQHALQGVDILPWPARSPDLSPTEHVWDIIGRKLQHYPLPAQTVPVLTAQVQQAWNSIPQSDIRHLYDTMHARLQACIQNSGDVGAKVLSLEDLFQTILEFEENLRDIQHGVQRLEDKMCSHGALGDVSCDPVLLDCLKVLLEEAVGMKNEISKLKKFAKVVIQKAGEGTDTTEILKSVDDIEKRYTTVTKSLESRCATLSASHKIITIFMEQMKSLRTELSNLDEAFDNLRPIARDLASLKNQLKDLKDIRSNLSQTKKKYAASEKIYDDISKQEHISETKSYLEQINNLSKQITRLEEHINERETTVITMTTRIENFYSMYSETEKVIKSLLKKEEGFEASVGDVETIRKHQQKFKEFQSSEVVPLSKQIIEVNKIGQGLIQSATSGVDTTDLEQKLEILNNSWNSLQESINEKEKKLDIALLQSGKFQEALSGVQKWLIDTEEMVSNQKAPSPDFKVCKAQVQEQKVHYLFFCII